MMIVSVGIAYALVMLLYIAGVVTGIINLSFFVLLLIEVIIFLIAVKFMHMAIEFDK